MDWITGITINNYRTFSKQEKITIPYGSHLLIYGENGSGKSSIYTAVKDFFSSSDNSSMTKFSINAFSEDAGNDTGFVELEITSTDAVGTVSAASYAFSEPEANSTNRTPEIRLANKLKGFLDYKRILKAHALEVRSDQQSDTESTEWEVFLANWLESYGSISVTPKELVRDIEAGGRISETVPVSISDAVYGKGDRCSRIGYQFKARLGKRYGPRGLRLEKGPQKSYGNTWIVAEDQKETEPDPDSEYTPPHSGIPI